MRLATAEPLKQHEGICSALSRLLRPGVGFSRPRDVVKDPILDIQDKRAVLASWASDASAVVDAPTLRWLWGTPEPVPLLEVKEAIWRLDEMEGLCGSGIVSERACDARQRNTLQ